MKRFFTSNVVYGLVLLWSLAFLGGFAYGQDLGEELPQEVPELQQGQMETLEKPVTCTGDAYAKVKKFLQDNHGERGLFRFITEVNTGIEVFVNPYTGSATILEFLPQSGVTCIISEGKNAEINSQLIEQYFKKQGTITEKRLDKEIEIAYK